MLTKTFSSKIYITVVADRQGKKIQQYQIQTSTRVDLSHCSSIKYKQVPGWISPTVLVSNTNKYQGGSLPVLNANKYQGGSLPLFQYQIQTSTRVDLFHCSSIKYKQVPGWISPSIKCKQVPGWISPSIKWYKQVSGWISPTVQVSNTNKYQGGSLPLFQYQIQTSTRVDLSHCSSIKYK